MSDTSNDMLTMQAAFPVRKNTTQWGALPKIRHSPLKERRRKRKRKRNHFNELIGKGKLSLSSIQRYNIKKFK